MKRLALLLIACALLAGCSGIPLNEGGLELNKNTTATLDGDAVARVTNHF
ncbi:MAG: hypothetical protein WC592_03860 [Candidatus Omnitrophota bacterium]|nr:hypothetical protein [Candidatus Omnitrophota bacterium]